MNHLRILDMLTMCFDHIRIHYPPHSFQIHLLPLPLHSISSLNFKCSFPLEFYKSIVFILSHVLLPPPAPSLHPFLIYNAIPACTAQETPWKRGREEFRSSEDQDTSTR